MGQLEKYGLYVLCLVIFLILGVAIWGGEPQAAGGGKPLALQNASEAVHKDAGRGPIAGPAADAVSQLSGLNVFDKSELPKPPAKEADKSGYKPGGKDDKGGDGKTVDGKGKAGTANAEAGRTRYRIKHGDTLEEIAIAQLGSRTYVADIKKLNPGLDERHLKLDSEIVLPAKAELAGATPARKDAAKDGKDAKEPAKEAGKNEGWRWYEVKSGDTYEGISKSQFHDVHHVDAIKRLNPGIEPNRIHAGLQLKVPLK